MHPPSLFQLSWQVDSEALFCCVSELLGYLSVSEKMSDMHQRYSNNIKHTLCPCPCCPCPIVDDDLR